MNEFWSVVIAALLGSLPGLYAVVTRRRAVNQRAQAVAGETTIQQFNLLYDEQRRTIEDCRGECARLRVEVAAAVQRERVTEIQVRELKTTVEKYLEEIGYLKGVIRRMGGPQ